MSSNDQTFSFHCSVYILALSAFYLQLIQILVIHLPLLFIVLSHGCYSVIPNFCTFWRFMPPSGADSATFKDIILIICTVIKGLQFDICLISSCLWTIVRFSVSFITRLFSSIFLFFYDAGLNQRFDLNTCTTVKAVWRLSNFYWMIANT